MGFKIIKVTKEELNSLGINAEEAWAVIDESGERWSSSLTQAQANSLLNELNNNPELFKSELERVKKANVRTLSKEQVFKIHLKTRDKSIRMRQQELNC
ncbi:hypothetical protein ACOKV8_004593 [Vibrio parahaemolyticus]